MRHARATSSGTRIPTGMSEGRKHGAEFSNPIGTDEYRGLGARSFELSRRRDKSTGGGRSGQEKLRAKVVAPELSARVPRGDICGFFGHQSGNKAAADVPSAALDVNDNIWAVCRKVWLIHTPRALFPGHKGR